MDFEAIKAAARGYQADMTRFLREMIYTPAKAARSARLFTASRRRWSISAMTRWR